MKIINPARGERGSTIVFVTLSMTALLSIVALAVDVGMLYDVRTEAQRTADAAALAGAGTFVMEDRPLDSEDEAEARAEAIDIGGRNLVHGDFAQILPGDVEVDLARGRVTVTVRRLSARGNAIPTWFANVFGIGKADVAARATAQVDPAGSATCLKPFAIQDRFKDVDGDGVFEPEDGDDYDPAVHGYGSSWRNSGQPGADGHGFANDFGRPIVLKGGGPNGSNGNGNGGGNNNGGGGGNGSVAYPGTGPSWYYAWAMPQPDGGPANGANRYRWNIANCNPVIVSVGDEHDVEPGAMVGPTVQGVEDLIDLDPWATWDDASNEVTGSAWDPAWEGSPRIGIVPVFHPGREFHPGRKPIEFSNFIAVFFEGVEGNGNDQIVYGRVLYPRGVGGAEAVSPAAQFVHLVE